MLCRSCGSENPPQETRCGRCRARLHDGNARPAPETYPVVDGAAAPDFAYRTAPQSQASPRLEVCETPNDSRRGGKQGSLFPHFALRLVGRAEKQGHEPPPKRSNSKKEPAPQRQTSFDFATDGPSREFLNHEIDRHPDYEVATLAVRARATFLDLCMVGALMGLFLLTLRVGLQGLPTDLPFKITYAVAVAVIALLYKMAFICCGQVTPGLQLAHLHLVSFDNRRPAPGQMMARVFGGWLSTASAGMGLLWAIVDEDRLSWHDHISQTFLTDGTRSEPGARQKRRNRG